MYVPLAQEFSPGLSVLVRMASDAEARPQDIGAGFVLLAVVGIGALAPALRASRVDPAVGLRHE